MDPVDLYRVMLTAREIDRVEAELVRRGDAFFHVSGAGHEATAALASALQPEDWLHCHYRDKALMLARGLTAQDFFESLYCTDASHSRGRQMSAHMSSAAHRILSITGPVGNSALQAVGVAAEVADDPTRPIVTCMVGDGTTQQGEFLEACGEAVRSRLPVLFFVEDNRWAISTTTEGKTFYSLPDGIPAHLFGMPIHHVDGRDVGLAEAQLQTIVGQLRFEQSPTVIVFHAERLASHTNADDQRIYRSESEIAEAAASGDPIERWEATLVSGGVSWTRLQMIREEVVREVASAEEAAAANRLQVPPLSESAKKPLPESMTSAQAERHSTETNGERLTMRDAIREVLNHHLQHDPSVTLYGQDIEDPKGDVFGVTRGLSTQYGERVANAPLSESTIIGKSIGRALAGGKPVAFLQFADFLPLAYNQLVSEMGSMHWRTDGTWQSPVIVMAACGGYRPGLGPFHAQTFESLMAHTPGIDVLMPSTAEDAAGMLNAAFASGRPSVYFYPKSCLNDPQNTTGRDIEKVFTPIGKARTLKQGRDVTLVGWGNTVKICLEVAETLEDIGIEADVLDMRYISPWDEEAVIASAERTAHLVVVHEDNHTCGLGAEIMATVSEKSQLPVTMRRVTRPDTFVPCNFDNQEDILPSFARVLGVVAEMLDLDLEWQQEAEMEPGFATIDAVGSGPADETVIVVSLTASPGDEIARGDVIGELEATKSVFELQASTAGTVEQILVQEGETVAVGAPLLKLRTAESVATAASSNRGPGTPRLKPRRTSRLIIGTGKASDRQRRVGLVGVSAVSGSRQVTNTSLAQPEGLTPVQVEERTGIASRRWGQEDESAVSMAVEASQQLLTKHQLAASDLDLVICATATPGTVTPSVACRVLSGLADGGELKTPAYDVNAACSGYLYALQNAYNHLQTHPEGKVLIVTAEMLSPLLDQQDQDTVFLFGDASTATLLVGESHFELACAQIHSPELNAKGDDVGTLTVPFEGQGFISMNGRKVFSEAVRSMLSSLNRTCHAHGLSVGDLDVIVPHQANERITMALRRRVGEEIEVYSNIREHGNTSSSSIPLCLAETLESRSPGTRIGLCAFGGGFTFGAAVLESVAVGSSCNTRDSWSPTDLSHRRAS